MNKERPKLPFAAYVLAHQAFAAAVLPAIYAAKLKDLDDSGEDIDHKEVAEWCDIVADHMIEPWKSNYEMPEAKTGENEKAMAVASFTLLDLRRESFLTEEHFDAVKTIIMNAAQVAIDMP